MFSPKGVFAFPTSMAALTRAVIPLVEPSGYSDAGSVKLADWATNRGHNWPMLTPAMIIENSFPRPNFELVCTFSPHPAHHRGIFRDS
jgi:hypothetical protein